MHTAPAKLHMITVGTEGFLEGKALIEGIAHLIEPDHLQTVGSLHRALIGLQFAGDYLQQGGFAAAVQPGQAELQAWCEN